MSSARVTVLYGASFENAPGMKSQLRFFVLMVDKHNGENVVYYGSGRWHRVVWYVMVAELHVLAYAFDHAYMVRRMLERLFGHKMSLEIFVHSRTLFNVIVKDSGTAERRLLVDVFELKKSCRRGELNRIGWIPGNERGADVLTKKVMTRN